MFYQRKLFYVNQNTPTNTAKQLQHMEESYDLFVYYSHSSVLYYASLLSSSLPIIIFWKAYDASSMYKLAID